jgi:arginine/lysine/ornithine decarboxylase
MAYQVNKTDGTIVATVADGQLDQLSTDLTLIGKNYSGFGEALNENFIKLLENFANTSRPTNPIRGQIWFDVAELKLKVYNGSEFLPVSSATVSNTRPATLAIGDLWFNNLDAQLYFFDGTNPLLLGPAYSTTQGLSGLKVESILDTLNQTKVITSLYNNGILLGIFAKDSFTPKTAIIGFNGSIQP